MINKDCLIKNQVTDPHEGIDVTPGMTVYYKICFYSPKGILLGGQYVKDCQLKSIKDLAEPYLFISHYEPFLNICCEKLAISE